MDQKVVENWIEAYVRAWNTNDPDDIGRLFAPDAVYHTSPFAEPWQGQQDIVEKWLARKDEPGNTRFRYEVLAVQDWLAVVRGWTEYLTPPTEYSNVWVIRFDDTGRCIEFTEWWMLRI